MRGLIVVCAAVVLFIFAGAAFGLDSKLATINFSAGMGSSLPFSQVNIGWGGPRYDPFLNFGLFSSGDNGVTVSLNHNAGSAFDYYASVITSGTEDVLYFQCFAPQANSGGAWGTGESGVLKKLISSPYVDLYGYAINRIDLTLNNITISPPNSNWTNVSYNATYSIYGTPEPATLLLLGLGGLMLRKKR